VPASASYASCVEWMVDYGITAAITLTLFGPDQALTRAQMVTFVWHQANKPMGSPTDRFDDVSAGTYDTAAASWAKAEEITSGTSKDSFSPSSMIRRAQAAAMLYREAVS